MGYSELARQRPQWMTVRAPSANTRFAELRGIMREGGLHTVCEEARCPNIGECWGRGTATFQILGDVCTRACRYCAVTSGRPQGAPEPLEPLRVARRCAPECGVEVLVPDFLGFQEDALRIVLAEAPDVFNHNIETADRLYRRVRPKGDYRRALHLLDHAKDVWAELHPSRPPVLTKSGIIVGMGETDDEVVGVMSDLRTHRVDVVTIGQYLQPTERHLPLDRWVTPDEFRRLRERGEALGFGSVFAGPLVRSSYRADEQRLAASGESRVAAH